VEEETVHSERLYDGKVVSLRVDSIRMADGRLAKREVVEHRAAVAIVPVDSNGDIVMVRQYRRPAGAELLELPAGVLEEGEEPADAVQRELQEETGFRAERIRRLTGFWVAPGYTTEFIHVYLGEGLVASRLDPDEDEAIEVEVHPLSAALAMIDSGDICDAKSIIGLLAVARERMNNAG
jgi:ADP-ribose pyrophosphatase